MTKPVDCSSRRIAGFVLVGCAALALLAGAGNAFAQGSAAQAQSESAAKEPPAVDPKRLRELLGKGGYVIYFRHAATDTGGMRDEAADISKCETQRNLSEQGKEQARQIGAAFRALQIKVGSVVTSPFCRCKDTGQLAFGRHTVSNELYFAISVAPEERKRITDSLRKMLSTPPAPGTNTVLVSHTANLSEAAGIWPKPEGAAYIFRPLPGGRFEAVGKALPGDWTAAAGGKPAAR